jgi:hypothetical protein
MPGLASIGVMNGSEGIARHHTGHIDADGMRGKAYEAIVRVNVTALQEGG